MTVAALATTLEKAAELENMQAKASITPTRVCFLKIYKYIYTHSNLFYSKNVREIT
jgi:hypothetical protein